MHGGEHAEETLWQREAAVRNKQKPSGIATQPLDSSHFDRNVSPFVRLQNEISSGGLHRAVSGENAVCQIWSLEGLRCGAGDVMLLFEDPVVALWFHKARRGVCDQQSPVL